MVPEAERIVMASARYEVATHTWWVAVLGRLHDADGPSGEHALDGRRIHAHWPVGCYVAVDVDGRVRYVGQVHRTLGGFTERFAHHHQPVDQWHRVWLLPLRPDVPAHVVSLIEALLIWTLRPADNRRRPSLAVQVAHPI
jgi:hypothetical protein